MIIILKEPLILEMQSDEHTSVEIQKQMIVDAFRIIGDPLSNSVQISKANQYLCKCQLCQQFAETLLKIFGTVENQQVELQSLILLTNVIRRNWQKKRNTSQGASLQNKKDMLREGIIECYKLKMTRHRKHLNQVIKYLAKQDYPLHYPQLQQFMKDSLSMLNRHDNFLQILLGKESHQVMGLLSTIKIVIKEYTFKRVYHQKSNFFDYILVVIHKILGIQGILYKCLQQLSSASAQLNDKHIRIILQAQRKIDKIMLYGLQCAPNQLQSMNELAQIINRAMSKINIFQELLHNLPKHRQDLQKNICAVIENASRIQSQYPFLFTDFLESYLCLILTMNMNPQNYQSQELHCVLINSLTRPFQTASYYMSEKEFKNSILSKKSALKFPQQQKKCHDQFMNTFNSETLVKIFEKVLVEFINYFPNKHWDNEPFFQHLEPGFDGVSNPSPNSDPSPNELFMNLLKSIMKCFKDPCKPILQSIFKNLLRTEQKIGKNPVLVSFVELILILPQVYDITNLPASEIFNLSRRILEEKQFLLFARLINSYHEHMDTSTLSQSFRSLIRIVSHSVNADTKTLYHCVITIKKMLKEHQRENLPLDNIEECVRKVIQLLKQFINNPLLMWPLVNLTNQLSKTLPKQVTTLIFSQMIQSLQTLFNLKNGEELSVCGISQLLQNFLQLVSIQPQSLLKCLLFVGNNMQNSNLQSMSNLYRTWLCVLKHYQSHNNSYDANKYAYSMLERSKQGLLNEDVEIYIQLLEEYMISGLLSFRDQELWSVYTKILNKKPEQLIGCNRPKLLIPLFSLYFSYSLKFNTCSKNWIKLMIKEILNANLQVSPRLNALRTIILIVFHENVCRFGAENIYSVLREEWPDYREWFMSYCWSMEYVSNKYAFKINSAGILASLNFWTSNSMLQRPIQNWHPFDTILKVSVIQLEPLKATQCIDSYANIFKAIDRNQLVKSLMKKDTFKSRKINLQFLDKYAEKDLTPTFRQLIGKILESWGWETQHLTERFDKSVAQKIITIVQGVRPNLQVEMSYS